MYFYYVTWIPLQFVNEKGFLFDSHMEKQIENMYDFNRVKIFFLLFCHFPYLWFICDQWLSDYSA